MKEDDSYMQSWQEEYYPLPTPWLLILFGILVVAVPGIFAQASLAMGMLFFVCFLGLLFTSALLGLC